VELNKIPSCADLSLNPKISLPNPIEKSVTPIPNFLQNNSVHIRE